MEHAQTTAAHGGHGHDAAPHGGHHAGLSYFAVFMILLIVTVAEVAWAYVTINQGFKIFVFIAMALYKAVMVALYFMHLKHEKRGMWVVASAPLFLGVLITIGSYTDSEKGTTAFKKGELRPWEPQAQDAPADAPEGGPERAGH